MDRTAKPRQRPCRSSFPLVVFSLSEHDSFSISHLSSLRTDYSMCNRDWLPGAPLRSTRVLGSSPSILLATLAQFSVQSFSVQNRHLMGRRLAVSRPSMRPSISCMSLCTYMHSDSNFGSLGPSHTVSNSLSRSSLLSLPHMVRPFISPLRIRSGCSGFSTSSVGRNPDWLSLSHQAPIPTARDWVHPRIEVLTP